MQTTTMALHLSVPCNFLKVNAIIIVFSLSLSVSLSLLLYCSLFEEFKRESIQRIPTHSDEDVEMIWGLFH